jgi:Leu/Phe-tRNA-protein transferase
MYTKASRETDINVISFVQKGEAKSRKDGKDTTNALASLGTGEIDKKQYQKRLTQGPN